MPIKLYKIGDRKVIAVADMVFVEAEEAIETPAGKARIGLMEAFSHSAAEKLSNAIDGIKPKRKYKKRKGKFGQAVTRGKLAGKQEDIEDDFRDGMKPSEIAEKHGVHVTSIYPILKKAGLWGRGKKKVNQESSVEDEPKVRLPLTNGMNRFVCKNGHASVKRTFDASIDCPYPGCMEEAYREGGSKQEETEE